MLIETSTDNKPAVTPLLSGLESMLLVTGEWGNTDTFKMIPAIDSAPYVECIYNPIMQILVVIGKNKKDQFHFVAKLDEDGNALRAKKFTTEEPHQKERITLESYQEYYVIGNKEIEDFINTFSINAHYYDYKRFLEVGKAKTSTIIQQSGIIIP